MQALHIFRQAIPQQIDRSDLHDDGKLKRCRLYLVADESFAEYGLHTDDVLVVCDGCLKHDGLVLVQTKSRHPRIYPHHRNGPNPLELLEAEPEPDATDEPKVLGSIIGVIPYPRYAVRRRPLVVASHDIPTSKIRIGVPAWPDAMLVAYLSAHQAEPASPSRAAGEQQIEFVIREEFRDLRADLALGVIDALIATREAVSTDTERIGRTVSEPMYVYQGNCLYMREYRAEGGAIADFFNSIGSKALSQGNIEKLKGLLQDKTVGVSACADDEQLLIRFFLQLLPGNAAPPRDSKTAWSVIQESFGLECRMLDVSESRSETVSVDAVWRGPKVEPPGYTRRVTTPRLCPAAEVRLFFPDSDNRFKSVAKRIKAAIETVAKIDSTSRIKARAFVNTKLDSPISEDDFVMLCREAITSAGRSSP